MSDIFYIFGIIVLSINAFLLFNQQKIFNTIEWIIKYKKLIGKDPLINEVSQRINFNILTIWSISVILTLSWVLFGLFTNNWKIFLGILLFNIIFNKIFLSIKYADVKRKLLFVKSLIIILTMCFLVTKHLINLL